MPSLLDAQLFQPTIPFGIRSLFFWVIGCTGVLVAIANGENNDTGAGSQAESLSDHSSILLSPFLVHAENDQGFVASTALAGNRLSTPLKDTPVAYSVVTRDIIDALALPDTESALAWSVGAYAPQSSTLNYKFYNNEGGSSIISRGQQTNAPQRNFFLLGLNADTYSQERIDFARGPNALLFGTSGLGGVVNGFTKQARTDRSFETLTASIGSWNRFRTSVDVNLPASATFAVRVNALVQQADGWRDETFDNRWGVHTAVTFKPFRATQLRLEYEYYKQDLLLGLESITDRVSGWDGTSVVASPVASLVNPDARGLARNGSATTPYLVYIPGSDAGRVLNWANTWTTVGGAANANVAVGGVHPASTSNLGINGGAIVGTAYDPNQLFSLAEAGSSFRRPDRTSVLAPDAPNVRYRFQNAAAFFDQQFGEHLFTEAAGNYAASNHTTEYIEAAGLADARIDVNETLPDGTPNPNFLQAYGEGRNGHTHFDDRTAEARLAAAGVFDDTPWGSFQGNVIAGGRRNRSYTRETTEVLARNSDPRLRPLNDGFTYRYYWNDPNKAFIIPGHVTYIDPLAGTTQAYDVNQSVDLANPGNQRYSDTRFLYLQAALHASLWRDRLHLFTGVRRDAFLTETLSLNTNPFAVAYDYPNNWNGRTILYRPSAPADYWQLMYVPKDTAGNPIGPALPALARPRTNGAPDPRYAGDRFQDDYSSPPSSFTIDTVTYGAVFHATAWLTGYANHAESFSPPLSGITLNGATVPPGRSDGWDAGVRLTLLDGRFQASLGRYGSTQHDSGYDSTGSSRKYATIASANAIGDLTPYGINQRGLALVSSPTFDLRDREATGYEIETVANLTPNWRLIANSTWPSVRTTRNASDEWAYLAAHEATLRQIVLDAGATIDAHQVATVNLTVPVSQRSPDVAAAAAAWNDIQTFKATNNPAAVTTANLPDRTSNLYTDYRFSRSALRGLRLGAGVQYIGRRIIGNRGADTLIDPADPTKAIDNPAVDSTTPVYRGAYQIYTGTIAYRLPLRSGPAITLQLVVNNFFDNTRLLYTSTGLRPPGGDLSRPDRVTVPTNFVYLTPRSYTLTCALEF